MNEKKKLAIFDLDGCLFQTRADVLVLKDNQIKKRLNHEQFGNYQLKKNESYDFSQFRSAEIFEKTSIPFLEVIHHLLAKSQSEKIIILSARSDFDDKQRFLKTLKKHGLDLKKIYFERSGNLPKKNMAEAKAASIQKYLNTGRFTKVEFYDDLTENLETFLKLQIYFPDIQFNAYQTLEGKIISFNSDNLCSKP